MIKRVNRNWDMSKCRKIRELERVVEDAWSNIDHKGRIRTDLAIDLDQL